MNWLLKAVPSRERGAALIIVLAFVVLLTGLGVAYLSRTTSDRQVAQSSFHQSNVDQLAQSAMDNIIGDLRQEVTRPEASTANTLANGTTIYSPLAPAYMVPQRSGNIATVPNLIRRSVRSDPMPTPGIPGRASAVNSTTDVSSNGRSVTSTRWNSHYLVPKKDTGTDDSLPIDDFTNATPDWVFVTNAGATPSPAAADVIGRYAYAIYDEGGLLDVNLAGYPTGTTVSQSSGKMSLAFADLTALPYPIPNPNASGVYQIDRLVGWRNYATTQPTNNFPDSAPPSQAFARNFQTSTTPAMSFYNFTGSNPWGPLQVRSDVTYNGRTDQMFLGRQELIAFRTTTQFSANALQYLGTFSREAAAGAPQWSGPTPTPTSVNPNFQTLLVTTSFTRNDGTTANVGDPLVNKPFFLQRLNWLTYKGPSAPRHNSNDDDIKILKNTYGVTDAFLQQGTDANILNYFGLSWDATNERWNYVGHGGSPMPIDSIATFGPGGTQSATREPDFFELLQAGILDYSVGDSYSPIAASTLPTVHQQSKMLHILTIGANLIAQSRADCYPVRIACTVGSRVMEAFGAPRLPYLNSLAVCPVAGTTTTAGGVNWFLVPNLWDPYRNTWDLTEPSGTPNYPRPAVRITVGGATGAPPIGGSGGTGSVGFGEAVSTNSGYVTSATPFPRILTGINLSLTLASGGAVGRDGFLEASRVGTSDFAAAPASYTTNTSPPSAGFAWNTVSRPPRPDGTLPGTTNFVVFRLSIPGSDISPSATRNPVLILKSGFQMFLDYQSPNGTWYSYCFLQGNNATNTWVSADLNLVTGFSHYGLNPGPPAGTAPTVLNSDGTATLWNMLALAQAPMFAKGDPRSTRYNSQIGVVNLAVPPMSNISAGIIGSIWPDAYKSPTYAVPPVMTTASDPIATPTPYPTPTPSPTPIPTPTPTPNANPAIYTQASWSGVPDNAPAASNPYSEFSGDAVRPVIMNRPFRNVGAMGYAFRDQPFRTLSFSSNPSPDAGLLELFSANDYPTPSPTATPYSAPTPTPRAGVISMNSRQSGAIAATLAGAIRKENALAPSLLTATDANSVGTSLASLAIPVINRGGLTALIANETGLGASVPKTERESIARALGEAGQTRTWNLLIDVIAQSGKYAPGETDLKKFVVGGEQRYWVHVAIDRFTGYVIDKQIEVVNE
jgi:hypothetical protein